MKIAYMCDYCDEIFLDSQDCQEHEQECIENPEVKACETCKFHGTEVAGNNKIWYTCKKGLLTSLHWKENFKINCPEHS